MDNSEEEEVGGSGDPGMMARMKGKEDGALPQGRETDMFAGTGKPRPTCAG